MDASANYISKEKKAELEKEFEFLRSIKRKEIIEQLEHAKSLGDLSENAEYHQAREEQGKLEDKINSLEELLRTATVIEKHDTKSAVSIGSIVTVKKGGTRTDIVYTIVGPEEADMSQSKISNHSPLGNALMNKKKGEVVDVHTPAGDATYTVVSIE
ncbi:MAG: transcription elongation factor GreA [Candidatus Pacebacteria bacterium]|nr:transcription elongation factor GreA [Candidatus Paceibacterota bacterium]